MTQVPPELRDVFDRERRDARVGGTSAPAGTLRMYARMEALQARAVAEAAVPIACAAGCSYCCHLRVEVRPHEAFALAAHVRDRMPAAARERMLARLADRRNRIAPLTREEHVRAGIACALLEDGLCTAYDARPAACRKYHSVSVETCRSAHEDPRAPLAGDIEDERVRLAANAVALGFAKGLDDAGCDSALYELHHALHEALANPKADKRYRKGKRAFV